MEADDFMDIECHERWWKFTEFQQNGTSSISEAGISPLPVWTSRHFSENKMERVINACELSVEDSGIRGRIFELIHSGKLFC